LQLLILLVFFDPKDKDAKIETSGTGTYTTAECNIPEDLNVHQNCRENLKSRTSLSPGHQIAMKRRGAYLEETEVKLM
jgi:hypothetical protein